MLRPDINDKRARGIWCGSVIGVRLTTAATMESPSLYLIVIALVLGIVSTDEELIDKRRPGWGKRGSLDFESNNLPNSMIEKRKPGWGKRGMEDEFEMNKRKPGWGKRAPGWGKRSFNEDLNNFIEKRRPGWGKRTSDLMDALNAMEVNKRKPGWGKRSEMEKRKPGWGKRTVPELSETDLSYSSIPTDSFSVFDKRRPGWGKRSDSDISVERRAPGWGKRAPGWGKRSESSTCPDLEYQIQQLMNTILKVRVLFLSLKMHAIYALTNV